MEIKPLKRKEQQIETNLNVTTQFDNNEIFFDYKAFNLMEELFHHLKIQDNENEEGNHKV